MIHAAGPMQSSSMAVKNPPWTKPAGLRNSGLASKPILTQPLAASWASRCQPSRAADGEEGTGNDTAAVMVASVAGGLSSRYKTAPASVVSGGRTCDALTG